MATIQGGLGRIRMLEHFFGGEDIVANTAASRQFGSAGFRVFGDGVEQTDSGITSNESDPNLNGVGRFVGTNESKHTCCLGTAKMIDVALNGPIVVEARLQMDALTARAVFMGLTDTNDDDLSFEDDMISGTTTAITLTASDLCGFFLDADLTDTADWHAVYNGGSTTGETTSTNIDLDEDATAGEYQILRLEVDTNGTARWFVDGKLKKTLAGAVSTTTDLAAIIGIEPNTTATKNLDVDYFLVEFNMDWTV